jgi:septal ring factor EnvC (AmiA/AmiB activator)
MKAFLKPLFFLVFASFWLVASSTSQKIDASKRELHSVKKEKQKTSKQLNKIVKEIKASEKEIGELNKKIATLSEEEKRGERKQTKYEGELKKAKRVQERYTKQLREKNRAYTTLLVEQFSTILALDEMGTPTKESMLSKEVYETLQVYNNHKLSVLKDEVQKLSREEKQKRHKCDEIEKVLHEIQQKRQRYTLKKEKKERLVEKLHKSEDRYQKKLQTMDDEQGELRNVLVKLNILQKKEMEEARRAAEARKEAIQLEKKRVRKERQLKLLAQQKAEKKRVAAKEAQALVAKAKTKKDKEAARRLAQKAQEEANRASKAEKVALTKVYTKGAKIRQVHSSYKRPNTFAYRGKKTISPLPNAKVVRKFGTFVDPIYKIKIFNEGVVLQAPKQNAKVRNVLNGTVVFSGASSMLGNVVVIAHSERLHTVYAGLASIAPNIKKGRRIKKGYSVGKVSKKLVFQAKKNSKHINPERLIQI